jgi:hypothetical protein
VNSDGFIEAMCGRLDQARNERETQHLRHHEAFGPRPVGICPECRCAIVYADPI